MYSQLFSPSELYRCSTQVERRDSGLNKEEMIEAIDTELGSSIVNGTYQFKIRQYGDLFLHDHAKNTMSYLCQNLVLRKLYKNIKTIYSVQQADRNTIIKQIKLLLAENVEMRIVRLDIRHFYHSVNRDRILLKLLDDARLSYHTLTLLQSLFSNPVLSTYTGLPRGIGISAVLSELYMKYFDLDFKKIEGVYYYARFVDDIIVFCNSETSMNLALEYAREGLKEIGLELNDEKSYSFDPKQPNTDFTYLGYTFRKAGKKSVVTIGKKKINVIKTRLTKSFYSLFKRS